MINKVMGSVIPKAATGMVAKAGNGSFTERFLKSKTLGKVLDVASENPTVCQSLFALGICLGPRPLTNFAVTEDKKDATYASAHSIASGGIGFVWPLVFATPLAVGVKKVAKNPAKYLKPEVIEKFYPSVKIIEEKAKNGIDVVKKVATNAEGKMLRKDGSVLHQSLEPLMIYGEDAQKAFESKFPNFYVERGTNVARIRPVPLEEGGWKHIKTENGIGKFKINKTEAVPVGEAIQAKNFEIGEDNVLRAVKRNQSGEITSAIEVEEKDLTPISEAMEIGAQKEINAKKIINMVPDIVLAPIRAGLTIALIPPVLKLFGLSKSNKSQENKNTQTPALNVVAQSNNTFKSLKSNSASPFSAFKKGGV